jgi:hypothetical protein
MNAGESVAPERYQILVNLVNLAITKELVVSHNLTIRATTRQWSISDTHLVDRQNEGI